MGQGILRAATIAAIVLAASAASAGESDDREIIYPKHTIMRFADDTVDGDLTTPEGQWVVAQPPRVGPKLIRIRQTFRREILASLRR